MPSILLQEKTQQKEQPSHRFHIVIMKIKRFSWLAYAPICLEKSMHWYAIFWDSELPVIVLLIDEYAEINIANKNELWFHVRTYGTLQWGELARVDLMFEKWSVCLSITLSRRSKICFDLSILMPGQDLCGIHNYRKFRSWMNSNIYMRFPCTEPLRLLVVRLLMKYWYFGCVNRKMLSVLF